MLEYGLIDGDKMIETNQEWKIGDCLELLHGIEDNSIDLILTDLPYGTTQCKWDSVIDLNRLWEEYKRIITPHGATVLNSDGIFTGKLMMSNPTQFKYKLIWNKKSTTGFLNAKIMPLRQHEDVLVFGENKIHYNPQMVIRGNPRKKGGYTGGNKGVYKDSKECIKINNEYYPTSIMPFSNANQKNKIHPTQKPVALFEYLIKTYTNEGDTVHDSCLGSGTTLEACRNTNRNCIGFEISDEWEQHYTERTKKIITLNDF